MDFWDLTKLLVRRWMVMLPMLVLSGGFAGLAMSQVKPDYTATAYAQLIPPVITTAPIGEPSADQRNPWLGLGLQTIGNAAIVTVTDQLVVEELKAEGYSDSFILTMSDRSPLITFEVVGKTRRQSERTAQQLVERFSQSVNNLQSVYGVAKADLISTRRLDRGTNVVKSTSKVKRAFVAVAGVGLLVSTAVTVGFDTWMRRRNRRRSDDSPIETADDPADATVVLPTSLP